LLYNVGCFDDSTAVFEQDYAGLND